MSDKVRIIQDEYRTKRLTKMDDESFIRFIVMEAIVLLYMTQYMMETAEEWRDWCTEEYGDNYYCGHNFAQLASDHKHYIEECIMNANKILDNVLIEGGYENETT